MTTAKQTVNEGTRATAHGSRLDRTVGRLVFDALHFPRADPAALALRGQLGAAGGWIVKALKVLDTVDPDDTDEAERLAELVKAGEVLALAAPRVQ